MGLPPNLDFAPASAKMSFTFALAGWSAESWSALMNYATIVRDGLYFHLKAGRAQRDEKYAEKQLP
jgi:hypothetical protein